MSSAAIGGRHHHSGPGPLSLMSCVRESSPLQDYESSDNEKNAASKKKFWNPKKWFKRKNKVVEDATGTVEIIEKDEFRSRSTSELSIVEDQVRRRSGSSSMHPGLSVSHDSVFHSPNSGSDVDLDAGGQSSSSLSISHPQIELKLQTELSERLRLRRGRGDTSEDDEGLPHSLCNSPTTTEALLDKTAIKDLPTKSHSTCSDGSLLSMGSSEIDEESISQQSRHSSKLSLHERRFSDQDSDLELAPSSSTPLNHSAAHHRVSVRPKRRAPHRSKRVPQLANALPTTPEVNEETSVRSMTPENVSMRESLAENYHTSTKTTLTETQLKCSSLPPGLVAPDGDSSKLSRSRSNAGSKSQDPFATLDEDVEKEERSDKSFFERIFPRRSAKKRKSKEEKSPGTTVVTQSYTKQTIENASHARRVESKPIAAPRSGAAARQRIQPIDLPPSPDACVLPPEKLYGTSPLHAELESRFKQRQTVGTPPESPKKVKTSSVISKVEVVESRSKLKIPGLSSLQQRVLSLNDEMDDVGELHSLSYLSDEESKVIKPVTKSHSFKSEKPGDLEHVSESSVTKAASLDSVKHQDDKVQAYHHSEEKEVFREHKFEASYSDASEVFDSVTISGPSHTAIVNVSSCTNSKTETPSEVKEVTTKESVSVTKIQLKRESTQITQSTVTVPKCVVPEFFNKQLNKVETKPVTNVVFSMNSPRIIDEQSRPKTLFSEAKVVPRKFSQEDIEIVERADETEAPSVTPIQAQPRFKKNEPNKRKSSVSSTNTTPESPVAEKPFLRSRSISLDSLKGEIGSSDRSSQDSLDMLDEIGEVTPLKERTSSAMEAVVLRRKSLIKQKKEEEPELMKVFARRSLKLKDTDSEALSQQVTEMIDSDAKTRDSDKENQAGSPQEERKRSINKEFKPKEPLNESKIIKKDDSFDTREPLSESIKTQTKELKVIDAITERKLVEITEVQLRRPNNNNMSYYARAFSVNCTKPENTEDIKVKKQASFSERRIRENWISSMNGDDLIESKISQDEIITAISPKSEYITEEVLSERKNFNQRKAEWEKRAQEAQKKFVP